MSVDQEVASWVGFALSGVLAILLPVVTWRHLRKPATLREAWLSSRPGWVVTGCGVALIGLVAGGLLAAVIAQTFPFMWGTFALFVGGVVAVVFYLVRFVLFDPRIDGLSEGGSDSVEPGEAVEWNGPRE